MAAIDTPSIFEGQHAKLCDYPNKPLGEFKSSITVAVVGAGFTGLLAARSLAMCGAKVDLYERNSRPAGRAQSRLLAPNITTNLGPMRHGDGYGALKRTIEYFGFTFGKEFENPGVVPTAVIYDGLVYNPSDKDNLPWQIKDALKGWKVVETQGFEVNGRKYPSLDQLRNWLRIEDMRERLEKHEEFERFVVDFEPFSLQQFLELVFVTNDTPPNEKNWTNDTINAFASYSFKNGNIVPFLDLGCMWFLKSSINGCDANQVNFCEINADGSRSLGDYQRFCDKLVEEARAKGASLFMDTEVSYVHRHNRAHDLANYTLYGKNQGGNIKKCYNEIVFAIPPPALTKIIDNGKGLPETIYPNPICDAIRNMHMINAFKIEWLVSKQPFIEDPTLVRCLQMPDTLGQVYILECNSHRFLKAMVYTWGDKADNIAAHRPADMYEYAIACIEKEFHGTSVEPMIPCYKKVEGIGRVEQVNWKDNQSSQGAVAYPLPGQDRYGQRILKLFVEGNMPLIAGTGYYDDDWWKYCDRNSQLATISLIKRHKGVIFNKDVSELNGLEKGFYRYYDEFMSDKILK
ncbi:hypothetical protein INT43_009132 [Umbelopsis isabellina]|uniref:Amine oxidase domain-containing protein n=1 Tax=Mortierella isabellina TaxID=91625 RepID=A0A8H7U6N8_MORIS|nr:hypothetical protein INT43_009132 [Umbelopsis isabellina]